MCASKEQQAIENTDKFVFTPSDSTNKFVFTPPRSLALAEKLVRRTNDERAERKEAWRYASLLAIEFLAYVAMMGTVFAWMIILEAMFSS